MSSAFTSWLTGAFDYKTRNLLQNASLLQNAAEQSELRYYYGKCIKKNNKKKKKTIKMVRFIYGDKLYMFNLKTTLILFGS